MMAMRSQLTEEKNDFESSIEAKRIRNHNADVPMLALVHENHRERAVEGSNTRGVWRCTLLPCPSGGGAVHKLTGQCAGYIAARDGCKG